MQPIMCLKVFEEGYHIVNGICERHMEIIAASKRFQGFFVHITMYWNVWGSGLNRRQFFHLRKSLCCGCKEIFTCDKMPLDTTNMRPRCLLCSSNAIDEKTCNISNVMKTCTTSNLYDIGGPKLQPSLLWLALK